MALLLFFVSVFTRSARPWNVIQKKSYQLKSREEFLLLLCVQILGSLLLLTVWLLGPYIVPLVEPTQFLFLLLSGYWFLFPKYWPLYLLHSAFLAGIPMSASPLLLYLTSTSEVGGTRTPEREGISEDGEKYWQALPWNSSVGYSPEENDIHVRGEVDRDRIRPAFSCQENCHLTKLALYHLLVQNPTRTPFCVSLCLSCLMLGTWLALQCSSQAPACPPPAVNTGVTSGVLLPSTSFV